MIALAVTWKAKPGREAEVASLFRRLTAASRQEPGCLMYIVHTHQTESGRFFLYEQYTDQAGLDAHRAAPHFLQYARGELPQIADRVQGDLYDPLD
jgi:quinol monooxygenase YgiN